MTGDDAFEEYFRANWVPVLQFVQRRVSDPWTAQDIAQECFVEAVRRFDPADPPPRAWLCGVAWNRVKKNYQSRKREAGLVLRLAAERPPALHDQTAEVVAQALAGLDDAQREILMLAYWDGLSAAEIGIILGISESAVWQRLSRARRATERLLTHRSVLEGGRGE